MRIDSFVIGLVLMTMVSILESEAYAYGNDFSCAFGKQGACLGYGDKICSSTAKCVSGDAVCFDSYACGFGGFVCKSKLDDLASEYDDLLHRCKIIAGEHDELVEEYNDLLRKYKSKVSEYEELESCISYSSTLDEAKRCH